MSNNSRFSPREAALLLDFRRKERFSMPKKLLAVLALLAAIAAVIAVGFALAPDSAIRPIAADSPCPVVGCASGSCHGFDDVPDAPRTGHPCGVHEMTCRKPRRVGQVPRVGNPRLALPPGVRCELEPVDTYAPVAPCGGACWHRAEGGTLMRVLVVDALALVCISWCRCLR